jgi:hypothetical protein
MPSPRRSKKYRMAVSAIVRADDCSTAPDGDACCRNMPL